MLGSKTPAVEITSLTHRYGDRIALHAVNLSIQPGEIFGLLGPNGGGKTTLFRVLSTLIPPQEGQLSILGYNASSHRNEIRRKIGVVFQSPSLDKKLTVYENLKHQSHLYNLRGSTSRARIDELLVRFQLTDRAKDRVETLSGGLRRRVDLAKGLLHNPELLLLDEPSSGLDPLARREFSDYLEDLRRTDKITVLLTTHLMEEADRCNRVAILDQGRLVAVDTPQALKDKVSGDVITIGTRDMDKLSVKIQKLFGVQVTKMGQQLRLERDRGHEFVPKLFESFPGEIDTISVGKPTLEDVFVHLTGRRFEVTSA